MSALSFQQQAVRWGQAYEVLVKRGVLACLIEQGLIASAPVRRRESIAESLRRDTAKR